MEFRTIGAIFVVLALNFSKCQILDQLRDSLTHDEQRAFIKVNVLLDTSPLVVLAQLQTASPQGHLSRTQIYFYYKEFKEGRRTDVSEQPKLGRSRTTTDDVTKENVRQLILESEGMRTEDLMYETGLPHSTLLRLLNEISARLIRSRWVPHELTQRQVNARMHIAGKHLAKYQRESGFLNKIIAIDETWLKSYDPVEARSSSEWLLPGQKA